MSKQPHLYDITIRAEASLLAVIIQALDGAGQLRNVTQVSEAPAVQHHRRRSNGRTTKPTTSPKPDRMKNLLNQHVPKLVLTTMQRMPTATWKLAQLGEIVAKSGFIAKSASPALSMLRTAGYVEQPGKGLYVLTEKGKAVDFPAEGK